MKTGFLNVVARLAALALVSSPCSAGQSFLASEGSSIASGNVIDQVSPTGTVTPFITANLYEPTGMAFNSAGDLFVANSQTNTIVEFSPGGAYLGTFATLHPSWTDNQPGDLTNIAIDSSGDVYVFGYGYYAIAKFSPAGTLLFSIASSGANFEGLAVAPDGTFYTAETGAVDGIPDSYKIEEFSSTGTDLGTFATLPPDTHAPQQMVFNSRGDLFVVSPTNAFTSEIDEYSPTGVLLATFGQAYLGGYSGQPAFDASGNLYVASGGDTVFEFSPSGSYVTTFFVPPNGVAGVAFAPQSVPEPASLLLLALGMGGALVWRRQGPGISAGR